MRRYLLFGLCFFLLAWSAHAQSTITLTPSDFFIQNYDTTTLTDHLVNVPISFPDQTYVASQLSALQLRNAQGGLDTQILPTSYYKTENGSGQPYVKTAIARVLYSSGPASGNTPAPAQIFTLQNTNPQTAWTMDTRVENLLRNVGGNALTVTAVDILGNPYQTVLDIDGYGSKCGTAGAQWGSGFPANCVKLLENGPVVKVWEIHKMNEAPTTCTTTPCLSHLFTNVFWITAIKGKDYVLVDHSLVNSFNFDEVTVIPGAGPKDGSGTPIPQTGGVGYSIWQNGMVFYDRTEITVTTSASNNLFLADATYLNPSRVDIPTGTTTRYFIMPTDGQQILSGAPYYEGPKLSAIPNQSNYIAGAQSMLSRLVVSFGTTITKHPVRDVKVHSGQELARWNNTRPSYFYPDVPDPNAIDPTFDGADFAADAQSHLTKALAVNSNSYQAGSNNHRFAGYGLGRDQGAAGYSGAYVSDPEEFIKYVMSCKSGKSGCRREYLDTFKLRAYGASYVTNHLVGFRATSHPEANMDHYRNALMEGVVIPTSGPAFVGCSGTLSNKDMAGFCKAGYPDTVHRTDAHGNYATVYGTVVKTGNPVDDSYNRTMIHWWTMTEPTHMSAQALYSWIFQADYPTFFTTRNRIDTISTGVKFSNTYDGGFPNTRGRGRYAKSISFLYSTTHDPLDKVMLVEILNNINRQATVGVTGTKGTNPSTGDWYPATFWAEKHSDQYPAGNYVPTFQYHLVGQGLTALFFDGLLPNDTVNLTTLKKLVKDNMEFIRTYGYKSQYEVRNQIWSFNNPAGSPNQNKINEGTGGLCVESIFVDTTNDPTHVLYTKYSTSQDVQHYPGLCGVMQMASELRAADPSWWTFTTGNLEWNTLFSEYRRLFDQVWIHPSRDNAFTNGSNYGLGVGWITDDQLCGLSYFAGLPHADGSRYVNGLYTPSSTLACPDADGDGVTTCAGDCADTNPNITPRKKETACTNNTDDNCNMLVDCNDPNCSTNAACNPTTASFCGNGRLDAGEQCDVGPGAGANGCGLPPGLSPPLDPAFMDGAAPDAYGYCVPPFTPLILGCQCVVNSFSLTAANPSSIIVNTGPTTVTLSGNQFAAGDTVWVEKAGTTPVQLVQLSVSGTITNSTIPITVSVANTNTLGVSAFHQMYVQHSSGTKTNKILFGIDPTPTFGLTSVSPSSIVNGTGTTFNLIGNLFAAGDQVVFTHSTVPANTVTVNGASITPTSMSATLTGTQVTALAAGTTLPATINVQVKQGAVLSNVRTFTITSTGGGGLTLSTVNPDTFTIGMDYPTIVLTGANIISGDRAFFTGAGGATAHGATANFTSTSITTSLTSNLVNTLGVGVGQLSIHRGNTNTYSNTIPFTIMPGGGSPVVTLTSTDTDAAESGTPATNTGTYTLTRTGSTTASLPVTITMTGTATNGTDYTTISTTQTIPIGSPSLNVTLSPIDDVSPESTETAIMTVSAGTGYTVGTPSAVTVNIVDNDSLPGPTLTQVNPGTIAYNQQVGLTLTGTNFSTPSTVTLGAVGNQVVFNNVTPTQNGTQINITLSAAQTQTLNTASSTQAATHNVFVTSNAQNSNAQPLTVTPPILNSVSPASFEYNTNPTIDLDTDYYGAAPIVRVGGISLTPTIPVAGTLRIAPSLNLVNTIWGVGNFIAEVENSTKVSNTKTITITDPLPTLTQVNPNTVTWNTANTITLTGTKFQSPTAVYAGSKVEVGTITGITPTSFTGNTQLQFSFSAAQTKTLGVGTHQIHVVNGSQTSAATNQTLTIAEATPTLNPIAASIPAGQDNSIVLSGANIQTYVEVLVGGLPPKTPILGTVTETGLTFNLSAGEIVTLGGAGTYPVRIRNDPTHVSAPQNLTITPSTGSSAPNAFILASTPGAAPGTVSVDWTSAGGSPAPQYRVVGIALSVLQTIGNGDSTIDAGEINNTALPWAYNQTDPTKPFVFTGSENTEYCFAGLASNNLGVGYSTTSCALTTSSNTAPSPFTLNANTGTSPGALTISWNDAGGNPTPRYRLKGILRSDPIAADGIIDNAEFDTPPAGTVWVVNADETSPYAFAGTPDTEYCFAAKARNSEGISYSSTDCETTPDDAPAPPSTPAPPSSPGGGGGSPGGGGGGGGASGGGGGTGGAGGNLTCVPTLELCDGIDNDCDTQIDEGCAGVDAPTCFNGVRDPGELRKDCGGVCSRLCYPSTPPSYFTFISSLASPMLIVFEWIARLFQW